MSELSNDQTAKYVKEIGDALDRALKDAYAAYVTSFQPRAVPERHVDYEIFCKMFLMPALSKHGLTLTSHETIKDMTSKMVDQVLERIGVKGDEAVDP